MTSYEVDLSEEAEAMLTAIAKSDRRIATKLADAMEDLSLTPEQKGRPLGGELTGLHSRHVMANRFRIVYQIQKSKKTVWIVSVGIREAGSWRDIYEKTKKILKKTKTKKK